MARISQLSRPFNSLSRDQSTTSPSTRRKRERLSILSHEISNYHLGARMFSSSIFQFSLTRSDGAPLPPEDAQCITLSILSHEIRVEEKEKKVEEETAFNSLSRDQVEPCVWRLSRARTHFQFSLTRSVGFSVTHVEPTDISFQFSLTRSGCISWSGMRLSSSFNSLSRDQ